MDQLDLPARGECTNRLSEQDDFFERKVDRLGHLVFAMSVGDALQRRAWSRRSIAVNGLFRMGGASTREFGVF